MRKRLIVFLIFVLCVITFTGCGKKVVELSLNKAPDAYVKLNEQVDASQFTVKLTINGKVQDLPITDSKFEVTGLKDGKLDTSSVGTKTITVTYGGKAVTTSYQVVNFLVKTYEELQEAVSNEGEYIVLTGDIEITDTATGITIPKDYVKVLELNGHKISFQPEMASSTVLIKNDGTLTIKDNTDINKDGSGTGVITSKALNPDTSISPVYANNTITNNGRLIIESGLIENTTSKSAAYTIDSNNSSNNATLTVTGGKIAATDNFAVRMISISSKNDNVINVSGGILEGKRAIWLQLPGSAGEEKPAKINISGGTLISNDDEYNLAIYSYTFGDSFANTVITISGGTFEGDVAFTGGSKKTPTENVTITGGYFKGQYGAYSYGTMNPFITGGKFKADPSAYVNLDTHRVTEVKGEYIVLPKS